MTKPTKCHVRPAKTQISLGIRPVWSESSLTQISLGIHPVWSESSLCAQWVAKDPSFLHADSEDSDQTGWIPRLIWVFAARTCHFVGFVTRRPRLLLGRQNLCFHYYRCLCQGVAQYMIVVNETDTIQSKKFINVAYPTCTQSRERERTNNSKMACSSF